MGLIYHIRNIIALQKDISGYVETCEKVDINCCRGEKETV